MVNSSLLKPLHKYACTLSLKPPQFCCWEGTALGNIPSVLCCSVNKLCLILCNPMNFSTPGLPVLHRLQEFAQIHVSWVGDAIQPSLPLSPLLLLPASGSFPMSRLFTSGGQTIGASASASVLPVNIQGEFHLGLTSLISLWSKGFSAVFSSITIWKHQFFSTQSLWTNTHIHIWLLEKP